MAPKKKSTELVPAEPTTAIVPTAATRELTPGMRIFLRELAPDMHRSRMFGVVSEEQAFAIMLKGYELGLSVTAAFEFIHVIGGKPGLSPRGMLALLLNSPLMKTVEFKRLDKDGKFFGYECFMERSNGFKFTGRFTLEDAQRAQLIKPDSGWAKYPENMCLWRAVGFAADVVFPDVTAGMTNIAKAPEMYGIALTEGGDVIEAIASNVPTVADEWTELISKRGDQILAVFGSDIPNPKTHEELAEVRRKLEAAQQSPTE